MLWKRLLVLQQNIFSLIHGFYDIARHVVRPYISQPPSHLCMTIMPTFASRISTYLVCACEIIFQKYLHFTLIFKEGYYFSHQCRAWLCTCFGNQNLVLWHSRWLDVFAHFGLLSLPLPWTLEEHVLASLWFSENMRISAAITGPSPYQLSSSLSTGHEPE